MVGSSPHPPRGKISQAQVRAERENNCACMTKKRGLGVKLILAVRLGYVASLMIENTPLPSHPAPSVDCPGWLATALTHSSHGSNARRPPSCAPPQGCERKRGATVCHTNASVLPSAHIYIKALNRLNIVRTYKYLKQIHISYVKNKQSAAIFFHLKNHICKLCV